MMPGSIKDLATFTLELLTFVTSPFFHTFQNSPRKAWKFGEKNHRPSWVEGPSHRKSTFLRCERCDRCFITINPKKNPKIEKLEDFWAKFWWSCNDTVIGVSHGEVRFFSWQTTPLHGRSCLAIRRSHADVPASPAAFFERADVFFRAPRGSANKK